MIFTSDYLKIILVSEGRGGRVPFGESTLKIKLRNLCKESASSKHLETRVFPGSLGNERGPGGQPAVTCVQCRSRQAGGPLGGRATLLAAKAGAAPHGPAGPGLCAGQCGAPGRKEPSQDRGAPASSAPSAAPRPPWKGLNFGPRSADTRGSVNAMTSPLGSAAQQEMLSASPLPARRKWGSFFPAASAAPAETYFRGRLPRLWGRRGRGLRPGGGGGWRPRGGGGCPCFAKARFPDLAGGLHCVVKRGRSGDHWPWGVHTTCIVEGTPGQVGQEHWRAPEIGTE